MADIATGRVVDSASRVPGLNYPKPKNPQTLIIQDLGSKRTAMTADPSLRSEPRAVLLRAFSGLGFGLQGLGFRVSSHESQSQIATSTISGTLNPKTP